MVSTLGSGCVLSGGLVGAEKMPDSCSIDFLVSVFIGERIGLLMVCLSGSDKFRAAEKRITSHATVGIGVLRLRFTWSRLLH